MTLPRSQLFEFPKLYMTAERAAAAAQSSFLLLIRAEYACLFVASIFSLNLSSHRLYFGLYLLIFAASIALLIFRTTRKPEQDWYKCRALAESVKTTAWRYTMAAEPYSGDVGEARKKFRDSLADILVSNQSIGHQLAGATADGAQTAPEMDQIRARPWAERLKYYLEHRIEDQEQWYTDKAAANKAHASRFRLLSGGVYAAAFVLVTLRLIWPDFSFYPTAPLLVAASALLGWVQTRKYTELASSYTLTAHEIGLLKGRMREVDSQAEFSAYVNDAELAFSREHTQWSARQTGKY